MNQWLEVAESGRYKLEHVGLESLQDMQDFMDRVAARLAVKGHDTWKDYLGPKGPDLLRSRFEEGEVYLVRDKGEVIAAVTLTEHNHFWKNLPSDKPALWVHIVARDPDLAPHGLGRAMLAWAEGRAQAAKRPLRLESEERQPALMDYLMSLGYKIIAVTRYRGKDLALYEKFPGERGKTTVH